MRDYTEESDRLIWAKAFTLEIQLRDEYPSRHMDPFPPQNLQKVLGMVRELKRYRNIMKRLNITSKL